MQSEARKFDYEVGQRVQFTLVAAKRINFGSAVIIDRWITDIGDVKYGIVTPRINGVQGHYTVNQDEIVGVI